MIRFNIAYTGYMPDMVARQFNAIKKRAFTRLAVLWFRRFRPKHFTRSGAREYGYAPRQGERGAGAGQGFRRSYTGQKLRTKGHTSPLVFSGEMRRRSRTATITATSKGAKIRMWAQPRNPKAKMDIHAEMTTMSLRENERLVSMFDQIVDRELNASRAPYRVRL